MRGRRLWTAVMRGRRLWTAVKPTAPDPILGLVARFKQDPDPGAVNLAQGAYRDDRGAPFVLPSVVEAERRVALALATGASDKEYLGIEGSPSFIAASTALALGANSPALAQGRVAAVQTLSGTGALRIAAESLARSRASETFTYPTRAGRTTRRFSRRPGCARTSTRTSTRTRARPSTCPVFSQI